MTVRKPQYRSRTKLSRRSFVGAIAGVRWAPHGRLRQVAKRGRATLFEEAETGNKMPTSTISSDRRLIAD